jgi:GxxExxY protein
MPIHCAVEIPVLTVEQFKVGDYRIMGHVFACQNELGRLCDEGVYETDVAARLRGDGFRNVYTQEPITVTHGDFSKPYFLDLLVDGGLYELKSVSALCGEHQAQLLNYMLLLGLRSVMTELLTDWGAFLEVPLYQEALTHFLGGEEQVVQRVPLARDGLPLGAQRMHVHAAGVAFVVTAYTTGLPSHEINLRKLLALTPLTALQWVNLDHANIQFTTLIK